MSQFNNSIIILLFIMMTMLSGCVSWTPLEKAAYRGDVMEVEMLLASGADINKISNSFNYTVLHLASEAGHASIVALLLQKGANVNAVGAMNRTPLLLASTFGRAEVVRMLLEAGADPSWKGYTGVGGEAKTSLQMAQDQGHYIVAKILTEALEKQNKSSIKISAPPPNRLQDNTTFSTPVLTDKTSSDIDTNIPTGKPAGKFDIAVVIGNQSYSSPGTPNVEYALNDARTMRDYLTRTLGYDFANIIYLENATLTKLYEVFGTENDYHGKLFKWVKPGKSRVFIYYAGHGAPDQESGEAYLVPVDANPQYIRTGGYKLSTFYENISRIPGVKKTVVIDACFSGSSPNGQLLKGVSGLVARMKSEPKANSAADMLFTSAGMDQMASWYPEKGHSLFTYFFLKGLQGEADTNKDGRITMSEMKIYLNDQVPFMARRLTGNEQQPQFIGNETGEVSTYLR